MDVCSKVFVECMIIFVSLKRFFVFFPIMTTLSRSKMWHKLHIPHYDLYFSKDSNMEYQDGILKTYN